MTDGVSPTTILAPPSITSAQLLQQQSSSPLNQMLVQQRLQQQQAQQELIITQQAQLQAQQDRANEIATLAAKIQAGKTVWNLTAHGATKADIALAEQYAKGDTSVLPPGTATGANRTMSNYLTSYSATPQQSRSNEQFFQYETNEGKTFIGTKAFIEGLSAKDDAEHPFSGTITTVGPTYLKGINSVDTVTAQPTFWQKIVTGYNKAEKAVASVTTVPVFNLFRNIGFDITSPDVQEAFVPALVGIGPFGLGFKETTQIQAGMSAGVLKDIEQHPIKQVALFGAGVATGAVLEGTAQGAKAAITAVSGVKAGIFAGEAVKVAELGGGLYLTGAYAKSKIDELKQSTSYTQLGGILGVSAKDIVLVGLGTQYGQKLAQQTAGWFRTRGMQDVTDLATNPQVESGQTRFVEAGKSLSPYQRAELHKGIFESKTDLSEVLGTELGGLHATSESGSDFSTITSAVHIAPESSSAFLGISGSSGSSLINFPGSNLDLFFENLIAVKTPGLYYFESPGGFKVNVGTEVQRGTYIWSNKLGSGEASYLPGTKAEVQAVFDPSVTSGFENVLFNPSYVKTLGVRVPIIAAMTPIATTGEGMVGATNLLGSTSSYGLFSSGVISSDIGYVLGYPSSSKSSEPSSPISPISSTPKSSPLGKPSYPGPKSYTPSYVAPNSSTPPFSISSSIAPISSSAPIFTSSSISYPPSSISKSTLLSSSTSSLLKKLKKFGKGYKTYLFLKGKKQYLPGIITRTEAIKRGEFKTLQSISARFGIQQTNVIVSEDIFNYQPSSAFRGYRIRGTARIPMQNEWIEKAGTRREPTPIKGARLGTRSAVREMMLFRRRK